MKVNSFEELEIYKSARELTKSVYAESKKDPFSKDFALKDQIRRSAVSIMANIAEGFERKTNPDFSRFLFMAKGSSGELRAHLTVALDQEYITKEQFDNLYKLSRLISSMTSNLIKHLNK